ncbi:uridine phosphorylase 1, partial [Biomphalaria pfeifferi]
NKDRHHNEFVLVGGTRERMETLARHLATSILGRAEEDFSFDHSFQNSRYSGYLVGPIFCVNHGIGNPSLSVALHEIFRLLYRARCSDVTLIRIGTCGGIGVDVNTVMVTSEALTVGFEPYYNTSSLGQPLRLPTGSCRLGRRSSSVQGRQLYVPGGQRQNLLCR